MVEATPAEWLEGHLPRNTLCVRIAVAGRKCQLMMCVEFLMLRASPERAAAAMALLDGGRDDDKPAGLIGHFVLRHRLISGDIALLLIWQGEVSPSGSALGQELKAFLVGYGIINHAVWVVQDTKRG